jgi:hypothetical protein
MGTFDIDGLNEELVAAFVVERRLVFHRLEEDWHWSGYVMNGLEILTLYFNIAVRLDQAGVWSYTVSDKVSGRSVADGAVCTVWEL